MAAFDDAKALVTECEQMFPDLNRFYGQSIQDNKLNTAVCIKVKSFLEHMRSALDYCATAIYKKHGKGKPSHRPYFPYAITTNSEIDFRTEVMERALPGVAAARPDIVDILAGYQHFGNTGNWMPMFMELANEHKHREFTPQAQKKYKLVTLDATIPPGQSVEIDLKNIKLGENPDKGYRAQAYELTTYEFITTGTVAFMFFEGALHNIRNIVNQLAAAC